MMRRAELPLLLVLAVVRLPAGLSSSCSGGQCGAENDDDPQSLLSIAARGQSRVVTNLSAYQRAPSAGNSMKIKEFRVKNSCGFDIDMANWGEESPEVHPFPKKFGFLTVKQGTTTGPLTRPKNVTEMAKAGYKPNEVRGCGNYPASDPGSEWPTNCYIANRLEFRRSGFGGMADGLEISFNLTGGPDQEPLLSNFVPNLCVWYGYGMSHKLTAYKPGTSELACLDAGMVFMGGDDGGDPLYRCEKAGGTRMNCTVKEGEAWGGRESRKPGPECASHECAFPDYVPPKGTPPGVVPGSISDCSSKPVAFLRDNYFCVNKIGTNPLSEEQWSFVNCLCPDPTSDGCNTITGYWAPETVPGTNRSEPCWYHLDKMQKGKEDGTCKIMNTPMAGPTLATKFGVWQDCIQKNVEADVELELCPAWVMPLVNDPCPIDYPFPFIPY